MCDKNIVMLSALNGCVIATENRFPLFLITLQWTCGVLFWSAVHEGQSSGRRLEANSSRRLASLSGDPGKPRLWTVKAHTAAASDGCFARSVSFAWLDQSCAINGFGGSLTAQSGRQHRSGPVACARKLVRASTTLNFKSLIFRDLQTGRSERIRTSCEAMITLFC